ncbi:TPA: hypothetical protein RTH19_001750, partial [Campylobacter jejuni]|nr:hypothetical protein [Campylobacter jejuni]
LKINTLVNSKEDKGVAASLDEILKTELINLINKKENAGVAKQLIDALRTELTSKINSSTPKLTIETETRGGGRGSHYECYAKFFLNGAFQDEFVYASGTSMGNNF